MLPANLRVDQFANYPPQAKKLAIAHLAVLQKLPLSFLPSLLRELIEYDYKFPAERISFDRELARLGTLTPAEMAEWFSNFSQIRLSAWTEQFDWVERPAQFTDRLSAYLWSTHQMDAFRKAATAYGDRLHANAPVEPLPAKRLGIAVIGQGVLTFNQPLFRKLRQHGTYFSNVDPAQGLEHLLAAAITRAQTHPAPYAHWYVDGGISASASHDSLLTCVSYDALDKAREVLLKNIQHEAEKPGMGPEDLHTHLARLSPSDLGIGGEALLGRFQVKVLTEGSGTQIFSTTFAQWTAREALRRAEPLTLLVRFAPRQRERPMSELLSGASGPLETDPLGSLIDADMAAYYHWINQQRLRGANQSLFLAWFEGHTQAVAIGSSFPRGTESTSKIDLKGLLALANP